MSEEFTYWCIVCKEVVRYPDRAILVIASQAAGGWYCGWHTEEELQSSKMTGVFDRGGHFYPRDIGGNDATQEGTIEENDQSEYQGTPFGEDVFQDPPKVRKKKGK